MRFYQSGEHAARQSGGWISADFRGRRVVAAGPRFGIDYQLKVTSNRQIESGIQDCVDHVKPSTLRHILQLAAVTMLMPVGGSAQEGPIVPPKPPNVIRIPTNPAPEKAPLPPDEIVRRFAAQEDTYARALSGYTYRRTVRLQEFGSDGKTMGQSEVVSEIVVGEDGMRRQRQVSRSDSTLHVVELEPDALEALGRMATFPFGEGQISNYNFQYQASEPVDDLTTYVFRVTPKQLDRTHAYFSGVIWVDDHDFAVVRSFGKWVSEQGDLTLPNLPFNMYETYRQPVSKRYWMPAYSRSDGTVGEKDNTVSVRLVVLWDHYTPIADSKPASATTPPASAPPASSAP